MSLLNDLFQALLIPLATWDVRLFGLEGSLTVTPLLLIVVAVVLDAAVRYARRHHRGVSVQAPRWPAGGGTALADS